VVDAFEKKKLYCDQLMSTADCLKKQKEERKAQNVDIKAKIV
jgi:hypothetical protein